MANRYETSVAIERFYGIDESYGAHNLSLNFAAEAQNCNTRQGVLAPAPGYTAVYPPLSAPITTLATFYRRYHAVEAEKRVLVAATATALYYIYEGMTQWGTLLTGCASGAWSWVTYETLRNGDTVDILILSNAQDGMVVVYGDTLTAEAKSGVNKFAHIERHAERIWGCGVNGEPDNLYYSQPYKPFDWDLVYDTVDQTVTLPEQSGGVIQVPTWDGDRFVALKRYSNYLLAFKQNAVFYVRGLSAGEFGVTEAFGSDGALAPRAVCVEGDNAYFLADGGLGVYDGASAHLLDVDKLASIFDRIGNVYATAACAASWHHVLYMALPVCLGAPTLTMTANGIITGYSYTQPTENNVLVAYDTRRGTYMIRTGFTPTALHTHGGKLLFTMGSDPSQIYSVEGYSYAGSAIPVKWVSAWQDLGAKNVKKGAFLLQLTGLYCPSRQKIKIGIETEKKKKLREITVTPALKKTRFAVGGSGRRFRVVIEADSLTDWEIAGGVQVDMELDAD